ncbi:MAG: agmatinase family protein [Candidatus Peribacteraceae bacterium]|jgi:agmatinase
MIFDPNAAAPPNSGIFGFPYSIEKSKIILIPVPWDATASYGKGASFGPQAIFEASKYIEFGDIDLGNFFENGISMEHGSTNVKQWNKEANTLFEQINAQGGVDPTNKLAKNINVFCEKMNEAVYKNVCKYLANGQVVGIIGGEHSVSFGAIEAHVEKFPSIGVLQIDAHCDLRNAFEGIQFSHASIMFNVLKKLNVHKIVQVGIRDFCPEEHDTIINSQGRIHTFFERNIAESKSEGKTWNNICDSIVAALPEKIYLSLDIDGLDPSLCPNTGTPVPGGLSYQEIITLLKRIVESGKQIVGFDLVEVTPGKHTNMDANVGAHLLYQLCGWCLRSNE